MARSEVNYIFDADTAFRAPGEAAVAATAVIGTLPLDKMDKTRGDQVNKLGAQAYDIVFAVATLDVPNADEVYTANVYVGAEGSAAGGTLVGTLVLAGVGQSVLKLDAATIEKADADREEITLELNVAGTAPSIEFGAWLALG